VSLQAEKPVDVAPLSTAEAPGVTWLSHENTLLMRSVLR